jgi:hypothetical protein
MKEKPVIRVSYKSKLSILPKLLKGEKKKKKQTPACHGDTKGVLIILNSSLDKKTNYRRPKFFLVSFM